MLMQTMDLEWEKTKMAGLPEQVESKLLLAVASMLVLVRAPTMEDLG